MDSLAVTRPFDLTDAQWAVLEPLLPARSGRSTLVVEQAAVDRRDLVADPGGRPVAGGATAVRVVVGGALFRRWQRNEI